MPRSLPGALMAIQKELTERQHTSHFQTDLYRLFSYFETVRSTDKAIHCIFLKLPSSYSRNTRGNSFKFCT